MTAANAGTQRWKPLIHSNIWSRRWHNCECPLLYPHRKRDITGDIDCQKKTAFLQLIRSMHDDTVSWCTQRFKGINCWNCHGTALMKAILYMITCLHAMHKKCLKEIATCNWHVAHPECRLSSIIMSILLIHISSILGGVISRPRYIRP